MVGISFIYLDVMSIVAFRYSFVILQVDVFATCFKILDKCKTYVSQYIWSFQLHIN